MKPLIGSNPSNYSSTGCHHDRSVTVHRNTKHIIMRILILVLTIWTFLPLRAQEEVTIPSGDITLSGTLLAPENATTVCLVIAGSGPTDRNGNVAQLGENNSMKMLAEELASEGIASLRYDKRGVGKSSPGKVNQSQLRFEHFVDDAVAWINYLDIRFEKVVIIGHSQGALVAQLAAQKTSVAAIVSLAGMAKGAHATIKEQMGQQPAFIQQAAIPILDSLYAGHLVNKVPPLLNSLFRPDIQPFLISFMAYDPAEELAKLDVPALIIQGDVDLQISTKSAQNLSKNYPKARYVQIEGMNHVLKKTTADRGANLATYSNPDLPLHKELMPAILDFISVINTSVTDLHFLKGTWKVSEKPIYEEWTAHADGSLSGTSYKLKNQQKDIAETLSIVQKDGQIRYRATVPDQNEGRTIPFLLTSSRSGYTFENPEHDFPNTITYKAVKKDRIEVLVSGKESDGFTMILIRK